MRSRQRDYALTSVAIVGGLTALVESLLPPGEQPHALTPAEVDRVHQEGVRLILSARVEQPPVEQVPSGAADEVGVYRDR